jgi:hypothetical protein
MGLLLVTLAYHEVETAAEVADIESRLLATSPDMMDSEFKGDPADSTLHLAENGQTFDGA